MLLTLKRVLITEEFLCENWADGIHSISSTTLEIQSIFSLFNEPEYSVYITDEFEQGLTHPAKVKITYLASFIFREILEYVSYQTAPVGDGRIQFISHDEYNAFDSLLVWLHLF